MDDPRNTGCRRPAEDGFDLDAIRLTIVSSRACRLDQVHKSGNETDQQESDQAPGRRRKEMIDSPSDRGANQNAPDECGGKPQAECHRGARHGDGGPRPLASLLFLIGAGFGKLTVKPIQSCRKRFLLRRPLVGMGILICLTHTPPVNYLYFSSTGRTSAAVDRYRWWTRQDSNLQPDRYEPAYRSAQSEKIKELANAKSRLSPSTTAVSLAKLWEAVGS